MLVVMAVVVIIVFLVFAIGRRETPAEMSTGLKLAFGLSIAVCVFYAFGRH